MKKFIKNLIISGILAFIILNVIVIPYNFIPVHVSNEGGNTDYVWPANSIFMKMTEGISYGKFDANGFNNKEVVENPDILVLGSSHMEATNVKQDESTSYLLSEYFKGKYSVYNMAISGHNISKVLMYLERSINYGQTPPKYIIIETQSLGLDVDGILQSSITPTQSHDSGLIYYLQKLPLLRLMYYQYTQGIIEKFLTGNNTVNNEVEDQATNIENVEEIKKEYETIFDYLKNIEDKYNTKIIILYHHATETLNEDGTLSYNKSEKMDLFASVANDFDVKFVDMSYYFDLAYKQNNVLPHGFITGELGVGHLNKYGHEAFAKAIIETIEGMEK